MVKPAAAPVFQKNINKNINGSWSLQKKDS